MLYFTELVLIPCSRAAQMRLSVSLFRSPFLNHSHSLSTTPILNRSLLHSVSFTNCPCSAFNFHSFNQFSFFSFLLTWAMCFSKLSSAAAVLTRASLLCVAYFDRLHFFSSTQSSTITRPLLGSPPYMVFTVVIIIIAVVVIIFIIITIIIINILYYYC